MKNVIVRKSKIDGKGVFAQRDFKKGEVVLKWNPKPLTKEEFEKLPSKKLVYVLRVRRRYFIMQTPEKYVNYSCQPNMFVKNLCEFAKKNIKKGEELTSDYGNEELDNFKCRCGSSKCRKNID